VQGTHRKSQIERDWETWMGCRAQSHWSHSPHSLLTPPDRSADCWLIINPVTLVYQKTLICIATSVYACSNQTARPQNAKACPSWMRLARCIQSRLSNECCNWHERFGTPASLVSWATYERRPKSSCFELVQTLNLRNWQKDETKAWK